MAQGAVWSFEVGPDCRTVAVIVAAFCVLTSQAVSGSEPEILEGVRVERVWSGHPVRFAVQTAADRQFVAYYDGQRRMTVAMRFLDSARWTFHRLPSTLGWDSHNYVTLAVDNEGFVHVSGNMHGDPLVYFRSARPYDISEFERPGMVGKLERRVTYPLFLQGPDGELFFQYRNGTSGDGDQIFNRYDASRRQWSRHLAQPLLDGEGEVSAYLSGPVSGPDGYFHLVWMWRDTPKGNTNHHISYTRSPDLRSWETVDGRRIGLPITRSTAGVVVDPVESGGGLAGIAFGVGWDSLGRPVVTYSKYDPGGRSQAYNARWEGKRWVIRQTSDWSYEWQLSKSGSLAPDIVVRPVRMDGDDGLIQWYEHVEAGEGGWVLDEVLLRPIGALEPPRWIRELRRVESSFPGMEVREFAFDRTGDYLLRWETLPHNRDRPRRGPLPEPSMLKVYRLSSH